MAAVRNESVVAHVGLAEDAGLEAAGIAEDAGIEAAIRSAIASHGPSLLFDADVLRALLAARGDAGSHDAAMLLEAQARDVPQQLLGAHTVDDVASRIATLVATLVHAHGMAPIDAQRAVWGWARILELAEPPVAGADAAVDGANAPVAVAATPSVAAESGEAMEAAAVERRHGPAKSILPNAPLDRGRSVTIVRAAVVIVIAALLAWFGLFRPSMTIVGVSSAGALVADGVAHDVTVAFEARRTPIRAVEVSALGGTEGPRRVEVGPQLDGTHAIAAGTVAMQSDRPGQATYRYVLIGEDGARSAPFEKTYDFAAAPPRPPVITAITVPPDLVAGRPFALQIAYAPGSRPIAQVEMRVASSDVVWKSQVVTSDAPSSGPNPIRYSFETGLRPSRTALDFTTIDQAGVRSAPARVVLDVRRRSVPVVCTPTTCGRVVATREIDPSQGLVGFFRLIFAKDDRRDPVVYEVVVLRDDGTTHLLNDTTRWNTGARVRITGNKVSLRCLETPGRCT